MSMKTHKSSTGDTGREELIAKTWPSERHRESVYSDSALNATVVFLLSTDCKDGIFQEASRIVSVRMSRQCILWSVPHASVFHVDINS